MPHYKQQPDGPWWASISVPGRPRIRQSLKTKNREEAETRYTLLERMAWQAKAERKLGAEVITLQAAFERAMATHFANKKSRSEIPGQWATLTRFISPSTDIATLTGTRAKDIALLMQQAPRPPLKDGTQQFYSPATINRLMSLLSRLIKIGYEAKGWPLTTAPKMPKSSEGKYFKRRALTREEYLKALAALEEQQHPRWGFCTDFLKVLWGTGCRVSELLPENLQWPQVDFAHRALYWDDSKGGNAMGKPMTPVVFDTLKARKEGNLPTPFSDYKEWDMRKAWDWIRSEALGITDKDEKARVVLHSIRHSAATRILQGGHSSVKAQKLMGHKTYLTTQRYEHLNVEDLREAAKALE